MIEANTAKPQYESCSDQMIGGLYIHEPRTCVHCMAVAYRQQPKPVVRWTFHRHRNIWVYRIGDVAALSSGQISDDTSIWAMSGRYRNGWVQ